MDCIGRQVQGEGTVWVLPLPGRGQYMCEQQSRAVVDGVSRTAGAGRRRLDAEAPGPPRDPHAIVLLLAPASRSCSAVGPGTKDELHAARPA
jgi:hypothetical protein